MIGLAVPVYNSRHVPGRVLRSACNISTCCDGELHVGSGTKYMLGGGRGRYWTRRRETVHGSVRRTRSMPSLRVVLRRMSMLSREGCSYMTDRAARPPRSVRIFPRSSRVNRPTSIAAAANKPSAPLSVNYTTQLPSATTRQHLHVSTYTTQLPSAPPTARSSSCRVACMHHWKCFLRAATHEAAVQVFRTAVPFG